MAPGISLRNAPERLTCRAIGHCWPSGRASRCSFNMSNAPHQTAVWDVSRQAFAKFDAGQRKTANDGCHARVLVERLIDDARWHGSRFCAPLITTDRTCSAPESFEVIPTVDVEVKVASRFHRAIPLRPREAAIAPRSTRCGRLSSGARRQDDDRSRERRCSFLARSLAP